MLGVVLALAWSGGASTALLTSLPEIALLLLLVGEAGTARCVVGTVLLALHALLPVAGMFVLGLRRA